MLINCVVYRHSSANWGNTSSLKLLQFQVEAAKKRQQMSLNAAAAANASSNLKVSNLFIFISFLKAVLSSIALVRNKISN